MHVLLRDVAVASDLWVRAYLADSKSVASLRKAMVSALERATLAADAHPEEYRASGATAFLHAMEPLLGREEPHEAALWHNQAVELFNHVILPIAAAK